MTDSHLMDANCVHGVVWYECVECAHREVLAQGGRLTSDQALELVSRMAQANKCCADDSWRGRFCQYHKGYYDALEEYCVVENDDEQAR